MSDLVPRICLAVYAIDLLIFVVTILGALNEMRRGIGDDLARILELLESKEEQP